MPESTTEYVVEVRNISKRYTMGKTYVDALKGVSLSVEKGAFTALVGESGSGKTTTLDLIGGLGKPSGGSILINGEDITKLNDKKLSFFRRRNIGFIFQTFNLIDVYTTYENIAYPLYLLGIPENEKRKMVSDIAEKIGLGKFLNHRPNELSGGQRQRVAIARALVKNPKIVIADEPTANLDSQTGQTILSLMQELNKTLVATFVIATHSAQVVQHSRKVYKLKDGELIDSYVASEK